jgi:metal-responsive CopG/Arc/MetJ family transcriptional regulator
MTKVKYIQTEIDENLHAVLRNMSKHEKKSIKNIVREAIEEYIKRYEEEIEKDTFFDIIGSFEIEGDWSERDDWRD